MHRIPIRINLLALMWIPVSLQAGPGFFLKDWVPRSAPAFRSQVAQPSTSGFSVQTFTVDVSDTVAPILPSLWGNNANFYLYGLEKNPAGLAHLRATGVRNLRLPGGNASNRWLWDGQLHWELWEQYDTLLANKPSSLNSVLSVKQMSAIADSLGAMPQPCVNLSLARYIKGRDSVEQAAHYAAEWVRQWNTVEKRGVKNWEVGNENYGGWQAGYIVNGVQINGTMYGQAFNVFADSMKAADPTIKIGAVVFDAESASWTGNWNQDLLPIIQDKADFLAVHQYFTYHSAKAPVTVQQMVDALPKIQQTIEVIEHQVGTLTNKPSEHFPVAMTEFNVRAGSKNSTQIAAVFNAMALGEFMRHGFGLVNIWDVANNFNDGDDQGMLTRNDPDRSNFSPNPSFYTYFLTQKYVGDHLLGVVPKAASDVRVYPTLFATGDLGILVVNSGDQTRLVDLDLGTFSGEGTVLSHHLTASSPDSREVFLNGKSENPFSGPLDYQDISPYARPYTGKPKLELLPYSVNTYLFKSTGSSSATLAQNLSSVRRSKPSLFFGGLSLDIALEPHRVRAFGLDGREAKLEWSWRAGRLDVRSGDRKSVV